MKRRTTLRMRPLWPTIAPPRGHWPQPDFLATGPGTPWWLWATLAMAALMLLMAGAEALALRDQRAEADEQLALWERRARRVAAPARVAVGRDAARPSDAARAAAQLSAQIHHPWPQVLGAVESLSASGVQWLALEHATERPELRLEGWAGDARTVLGVVDVLATRPGWSGVVLTRLASSGTEGNAGQGVRFDVLAQLNAAPARSLEPALQPALQPVPQQAAQAVRPQASPRQPGVAP